MREEREWKMIVLRRWFAVKVVRRQASAAFDGEGTSREQLALASCFPPFRLDPDQTSYLGANEELS